MQNDDTAAGQPTTALCLGHPGHELKVAAWMALTKPLVFILTDGSGANRPSRLASTRRVMESVGCGISSVYGAYADREIYAHMRAGAGAFIGLCEQLEEEWRRQNVQTVVGDALEGYNTTHDVARMMINALVERARRRGQEIRNYEFPLEYLLAPRSPEGRLMVALDETQFAWKRSLVATEYPEMAMEVERALSKYGEAMFRQEIIYPAVAGAAGLEWTAEEPPYYETYGLKQIQSGHYTDLISYREHLQPIAQGLWAWASA